MAGSPDPDPAAPSAVLAAEDYPPGGDQEDNPDTGTRWHVVSSGRSADTDSRHDRYVAHAQAEQGASTIELSIGAESAPGVIVSNVPSPAAMARSAER